MLSTNEPVCLVIVKGIESGRGGILTLILEDCLLTSLNLGGMLYLEAVHLLVIGLHAKY